MDYTSDEDELKRSMRVLKMRGSKHNTQRNPIVMTDTGIALAK